MNDNNKMLERVLLMMKYDSSKTLTENSDAVRNEFSQILNERGRGRPIGSKNVIKKTTTTSTAAPLKLPPGVTPAQAKLVAKYKANVFAQTGKNPTQAQLKNFKNNGYKPPTSGTINVQAPANSTVTVKPVKNAKAKPKVTSKDVGILSKITTKIRNNPWKTAITLGLTGGAIWYFLRDKTFVAPCLLNSLSEEEMAGLAGTTGTITRPQVGNRLADLNGGLIYSLDNSDVTTGNGKYKGSYSCEGDAIKISIAGSEFTIGSTGTVDKGTSGGGGGNGGGGGGGSRYKQCPETFPIAMYCKNSTIARVQGCVGAKQDGAFGPNTSAALVAKGADGSSITQATIDKVCGGGQSNKQSAPGSDAEEDDAGGGNTMTVKSSGPLATDDADEA